MYGEQKKRLIKKLIEELKSCGYSFKTGKKYVNIAEKYLNSGKTPEDFLLSLSCKNKSTMRSNYFALKFFVENILNENMGEMPICVEEMKIPQILTKKEVERILELTKNKTHYAILCALYYAGLRLNEARLLKWKDVNFEEEIIFIKGKNERKIFLHSKLKEALFEIKTGKDYVFLNSKGNVYSERTIQQIVNRAARRARVFKRVTPYTLRHCFAIHLLENGADIRQIQHLLGHKDIRTTQIYNHIANKNIKSLAKLI